MPDSNGFPTDEELAQMERDIETLKKLDSNFQYLQTIGVDVSNDRNERDATLKQLELQVKTEYNRRKNL